MWTIKTALRGMTCMFQQENEREGEDITINIIVTIMRIPLHPSKMISNISDFGQWSWSTSVNAHGLLDGYILLGIHIFSTEEEW